MIIFEVKQEYGKVRMIQRGWFTRQQFDYYTRTRGPSLRGETTAIYSDFDFWQTLQGATTATGD